MIGSLAPASGCSFFAPAPPALIAHRVVHSAVLTAARDESNLVLASITDMNGQPVLSDKPGIWLENMHSDNGVHNSIAGSSVLIVGLQSSSMDRVNRRTRMIADALRAHGRAAMIMNLYSGAGAASRKRYGLPFIESVISTLRAWGRILSAVRRHDFVHIEFDLANSSVVSALLLFAASGYLGKPSVLAISSVYSEAPREPRGFMLGRMLRSAGMVVTGSERAGQILRQFVTNVTVIPPAAPVSGSSGCRRGEIQPRVGLVAPTDPAILGSVIRSLELTKRKYPRAEVALLANSRKAGEIKSRLSERSRNGVDLIVCEDEHRMMQSLSTCDIYLETSPQTDPSPELIQASALGTPVIAIDTAGILGLIRHGVTGLVVAAGSHVDLANRLCELVESPQLVTTLSAGAKTLCGDYRDSTVAAEWAKVYSAISGISKAAPRYRGKLTPQYQTTVKA